MSRRHLLVLVALGSVIGLAAPLREAAGQATPVAPPGWTAETTALLVTATHDPLRVTGSDGMVHLEYDLVITNVFTTPVTLTAIDVLTPDGRSLLRLEGDALEAVTQPLLGRTPTALVPASGALAVVLDVVVPPDQVPERLSHRITYDLAPDAQFATIIGSREIAGPELAVDPFAPVVIAPPLRGTGWINANGCCDASDHRSIRLAVDGSRIVKPETFAIDWMRIEDGRLYTGDGTRNEDYFAFGAEVHAVADGTVAFVRDGMAGGHAQRAADDAASADRLWRQRGLPGDRAGGLRLLRPLSAGQHPRPDRGDGHGGPGAGAAGQHRQFLRAPFALRPPGRAGRAGRQQSAVRHRRMDAGGDAGTGELGHRRAAGGRDGSAARDVAAGHDRRRLPLSRR